MVISSGLIFSGFSSVYGAFGISSFLNSSRAFSSAFIWLISLNVLTITIIFCTPSIRSETPRSTIIAVTAAELFIIRQKPNTAVITASISINHHFPCPIALASKPTFSLCIPSAVNIMPIIIGMTGSINLGKTINKAPAIVKNIPIIKLN